MKGPMAPQTAQDGRDDLELGVPSRPPRAMTESAPAPHPASPQPLPIAGSRPPPATRRDFVASLPPESATDAATVVRIPPPESPRSSEPPPTSLSRRVSFSVNPVTEVRTFDKAPAESKEELFYTRSEVRRFRACLQKEIEQHMMLMELVAQSAREKEEEEEASKETDSRNEEMPLCEDSPAPLIPPLSCRENSGSYEWPATMSVVRAINMACLAAAMIAYAYGAFDGAF